MQLFVQRIKEFVVFYDDMLYDNMLLTAMLSNMLKKCGKIIHNRRNKSEKLHATYSVSFSYQNQGSEMIIFESTLTTFIASIIFRGCWGRIKNCLELKINPSLAKFSLPKTMNHTVLSNYI